MNTNKEAVTASRKAARVYATKSNNGERVEVIGRDSNDARRVLVLSGRGFTSYVNRDDLITASRTVARVDKRKKVYCAICGEEAGGRGTSFWGHVHKYGATTHRFKATNERKS